MILSVELRPFEEAALPRGETVSASIHIEGRSSIWIAFRFGGFGDRLVFGDIDPEQADGDRKQQLAFAKQTALQMMGLKPQDETLYSREPARRDGLCQHTCLIVFGLLDDGSYAEFHIAPSGHWAAYGFDGYRKGTRNLEGSVGAVRMQRNGAEIEFSAFVNWSAWPHVKAIGVSSVVETVDGGKGHWALAHPKDTPDFHHPDSFALAVRPPYIIDTRGRDKDRPEPCALRPHPAGGGSPIRDVAVTAERTGALSFEVTFELIGDIERLALPVDVPSRRTDDLWRQTCCEVFIARNDGAGYYELNLSPSGQWAFYGFSGYRIGMTRPYGVEIEPMRRERTADRYRLSTTVHLDRLPGLEGGLPWRVGLTSVIEDTAGDKTYWALAHPSAGPDFHHAEGFVLDLNAPEPR